MKLFGKVCGKTIPQVSLLSSRCVHQIYAVGDTLGALREILAADLELDPAAVACGKLLHGCTVLEEDLSSLRPGRLHELTLVLS